MSRHANSAITSHWHWSLPKPLFIDRYSIVGIIASPCEKGGHQCLGCLLLKAVYAGSDRLRSITLELGPDSYAAHGGMAELRIKKGTMTSWSTKHHDAVEIAGCRMLMLIAFIMNRQRLALRSTSRPRPSERKVSRYKAAAPC